MANKVVNEEDMNTAQEAQKKYWDELIKRMAFFREDTTSINIDEIFHDDLGNDRWFDLEKNLCEKSLKTEYRIFSSYWASSAIEKFINQKWVEEYAAQVQILKNAGETQKIEIRASKAADAFRTTMVNNFKKKYP
jgi:hypothetical protein